MAIQWNKVTWYSKLLALILFLALPFIGFGLGIHYERLESSTQSDDQVFSSSWKTYRNEKYGFEFMYPSDWQFEAISNRSSEVVTPQSLFLFTDPDLNRIIVDPIGDNPNPPASDLMETKELNLGRTDARWRKFGNTGGVYAILVDQFEMSSYPKFHIEIIPVNAKEYLDVDKIPEFERIISTFKLVPG